ncbi:hypothetical protein GGR32_000204 [Mesonia hippocampi]|uniref:3-keto-disaccharide hydrolase domain-containing protein n=1 Tax=Mesonia hippocampi TaxID=1628250 RepID=A0A840EFF4_9FLAO|nr:hypothetical protein [Mesonia hippocampi]MBB4117932.1 hypothetical protein [Mesonia hippocampi]
MKTKHIVLPLFILLLFSCAGSKNISLEEPNWKIISGNWTLDEYTYIGNGKSLEWATLTSLEKLPKNYSIELDVNMLNGSLFELMLNLNQDEYLRAYLYTIENALKIGRGEFDETNTERPGGGSTFIEKPIEIQNNTWYNLKVKLYKDNLSIFIDDVLIIDKQIAKYKLNKPGYLGLITNGKTIVKNLAIKKLS